MEVVGVGLCVGLCVGGAAGSQLVVVGCCHLSLLVACTGLATVSRCLWVAGAVVG